MDSPLVGFKSRPDLKGIETLSALASRRISFKSRPDLKGIETA